MAGSDLGVTRLAWFTGLGAAHRALVTETLSTWICEANWCRPSQTRASGARTLDPASGGFGSAERQGFRYSFGVHLVPFIQTWDWYLLPCCFLERCYVASFQRERAASLGPGFLSPTHLPPFQGEIGKPGLEEWGCLDMGESSSQPFRGRFRQSVSSDYVCLGVVFHS